MCKLVVLSLLPLLPPLVWPCPEGWLPLPQANSQDYYRHAVVGDFSLCYKMGGVHDPVTFNQARVKCREMLGGRVADLVSVHSAEEYKLILNYVFGGGIFLYKAPLILWMGLKQYEELSGNATRKVWAWTDGTVTTPTDREPWTQDWFRGVHGKQISLPPGPCGALIPPNPYGSGSWLGVACNLSLPYVCKTDFLPKTGRNLRLCQVLNQTNPCPGYKKMTCRDVPGTLACQCNPGYVGNNTKSFKNTPHKVFTSCEEQQMCNRTGICHEHAFCEEQGRGKFNCTCKPGYRGSGTHCEDADECSLYEEHPCQDTYCGLGWVGKCNNTEGAYECRCVQRQGYWIYPFSVVFLVLVLVTTVAMAAFMASKWLRRRQKKRKLSLAESEPPPPTTTTTKPQAKVHPATVKA